MPGEDPSTATGLSLVRDENRTPAIDRLAERLGARVGLAGLLADLDRTGRRARRGFAPGLRARHALTWDSEDRRTPRWWPQGITSTADASPDERVHGRRLLVTSWYAKAAPGESNHGSRLTFLDPHTKRYQHVLLVVPSIDEAGDATCQPLQLHAGGIVWCGPWVHVAATATGFWSCHLDDLVEVRAERESCFGYRYVLPVRLAHRAAADEGVEKLRYSFLSLDRTVSPPELVVGEYGRGTQTRRLVTFVLNEASGLPVADADGVSRPLTVDERGVPGMQGAIRAHGSWSVSVSHGPWKPGSVYAGRPGALRRHRWVSPMGPEDLGYQPSADLLWSVSEHPRRRWVFAVRRSALA